VSSGKDTTLALSPERQIALLASTHEMAVAFLEDIKHVRETVARLDPERGELRRLSAVLRRWLIDGDLKLIAVPRIGKMLLLAPDNKPLIKSNKLIPFPFCESGGAVLFGLWVRAGMAERADISRQLPDFDPERTVDLIIDSFLSQPVLWLEGKEVSRRAVIKFVANVASGVHSDTAQTDEEKLVDRLRHAANVRLDEGIPTFSFHPNVVVSPNLEFKVDPLRIDCVLAEMLTAASFLARSKSVSDLEEVIRRELFPREASASPHPSS